ncbi:hemerythrin domain-containing protein [Streptomyces sp. NPDC002870]|uniref:hemerythrin domain-containing protein n=1 Tax=Streptomyces sp. NPDC002870 TaxID=3364666 RepID=UPI0036ADA7C2
MPNTEADPLAVTETRVIHDVHRAATSLLADAAARPLTPAAELTELRDFLVAALHHHHQTEDSVLWPLLSATDPDVTAKLTDLSQEHDQLDAALDALAAAPVPDNRDRAALADAAVAVRDLVHVHLEHEELILLPALRTHMSHEDWSAFAREVMASAPQAGAHLQVAFMELVAAPEELSMILAQLPQPLRDAIPAMSRRAHTTLNTLQNTKAATA